MQFGAEVEISLRTATALVNTLRPGGDLLQDHSQLDALLDANDFAGHRAGSDLELDDIRRLRVPLGRFWRAHGKPEIIAQLANRLLRQANATPQVVSVWPADWHLELIAPSAALAQRISAGAAMGFIELLLTGELARLKTCAGADCEAALLDLSRNRSRRFCDTGNCGNREHVAAYRARRLSTVTGKRT